MDNNLKAKLEKIIARYKELEERLAKPFDDNKEFIEASKKYSELEKIVVLGSSYLSLCDNILSLEKMVKDETEKDLQEMAEQELEESIKAVSELEEKIKLELLPKDLRDDKNVILEIRAGTGGDEAGIFAADIFRMYLKYAEKKGWKVDVISYSDTGVGGYKEVFANITGKNVFERLKFESGVHRVQRVPETETNGRVHTSAATVAVLPEADDIDVSIEDKDLKIDTYRASGAGGQHVNTTDSAVRITHLPTGLVVTQQDEKSQHKNKAKAMKILKSRLFDKMVQEQNEIISKDRKDKVGSGDRSERIRTYNFPQGRVTDHRINMTLYSLDKFMEGDLDQMIDGLITDDNAKKLAEQENDNNI